MAGPASRAISRRWRHRGARGPADRGRRRVGAVPVHRGILGRGGHGELALARGVTHGADYSFAAASTTPWTIAAGSPWPASMFTTPVLRALPTFWP